MDFEDRPQIQATSVPPDDLVTACSQAVPSPKLNKPSLALTVYRGAGRPLMLDMDNANAI